MPIRENSMYQLNEPLLTNLERTELDELRVRVAGASGTYFEFYRAAKKYCNTYEIMMRSHGVKREE